MQCRRDLLYKQTRVTRSSFSVLVVSRSRCRKTYSRVWLRNCGWKWKRRKKHRAEREREAERQRVEREMEAEQQRALAREKMQMEAAEKDKARADKNSERTHILQP